MSERKNLTKSKRQNKSIPKPPKRRPNIELRSREYLTPNEVSTLIQAAGSSGRYGHRNMTMLLVCYRHALRVSELITLRWEQLDFSNKVIHINRIKHGVPSLHPLQHDVIDALKPLLQHEHTNPYVFTTRQNPHISAATVRNIVAHAGMKAGFPFSIHPHMLRHACGFYLANQGFDTRAIQYYMGHKNIQHTVRYTELTPERFKEFWT